MCTECDRYKWDSRDTPQIHGELFGLDYVDGDCSTRLVALFTEDDELWHVSAVFDSPWLEDLASVVSKYGNLS
jgi:hypothetical protein